MYNKYAANTTISEIRKDIKEYDENNKNNRIELKDLKDRKNRVLRVLFYLIAKDDEEARKNLVRSLDPDPGNTSWADGNDNGTLNSTLVNVVYGDRSKKSDGAGKVKKVKPGKVDTDLYPHSEDITLQQYYDRLDKSADIEWGRNIDDPKEKLKRKTDLLGELIENAPITNNIAANTNKRISENIFEYGKNVIFYGPPGTGKTRKAKIEAAKLIKGNISSDSEAIEAATNIMQNNSDPNFGQIRLVQFHPGYSYNDFMETMDITKKGYVNRIFKSFAEKAFNDKERKPYVLIIDEINRANVSEVLGELLYGLEYREHKFTTSVSESPFSVPENLYIIGTMNTADKSLQALDYAVRRRFAFEKVESKKPKPVEPKEAVQGGYLIEKCDDRKRYFLDCIFEQVKADVAHSAARGVDAEDIMPGVSYFIVEESGNSQNTYKEHLLYKLNYELLPLLKEYIKDGMFTKRKKIAGEKSLTDLVYSGEYKERIEQLINKSEA